MDNKASIVVGRLMDARGHNVYRVHGETVEAIQDVMAAAEQLAMREELKVHALPGFIGFDLDVGRAAGPAWPELCHALNRFAKGRTVDMVGVYEIGGKL